MFWKSKFKWLNFRLEGSSSLFLLILQAPKGPQCSMLLPESKTKTENCFVRFEFLINML